MAAAKKCCVPNCEESHESTILHKFPHPQKDEDRFRKWTFAIGGNILVLDDMYVYNYRRVCHLHFEEKYWTRSKFLTANAVPTLYLKGFTLRKPLVDVTNTTSLATSTVEIATASTSGSIPVTEDLQVANKLCDETSFQIDMRNNKTKKAFTSKKVSSLQKKIEKLTAENEKYAVKIKKALQLSENRTFQQTLKNLSAI